MKYLLLPVGIVLSATRVEMFWLGILYAAVTNVTFRTVQEDF